MKIPTIEKKISLNGWIALFGGIALLAIFVMVAFLMESSGVTSGGYSLGNLSFGIIIVGSIIGIPLIIVGTTILYRVTRFNDALEEIGLSETYQQRGGIARPGETIPLVTCLSCGKAIEPAAYCKYCGAKVGKRDVQ